MEHACSDCLDGISTLTATTEMTDTASAAPEQVPVLAPRVVLSYLAFFASVYLLRLVTIEVSVFYESSLVCLRKTKIYTEQTIIDCIEMIFCN
jgi:hypothetical protein